MSNKYSEFEQNLNPGSHLLNLDDETWKEVNEYLVSGKGDELLVAVRESLRSGEFEIPDNVVSMAAPKVGGGMKVGLGSFSRDSDYIPVYVPQPQYPRRAQTRGKEGYAVVEVIITSTGGVRDPIMIEEFPEGWGFGRAAVKAALKLKYNPRVVDGVGQEVPNVLYKFSFQMAK